jgi:hypothetical protein
MTCKIEDNDLGWKKILQNLRDTERSRSKVGVVGEAGKMRIPPSNLPAATVALIQEFGAGEPGERGYVPERSFLRKQVDEHLDEIGEALAVAGDAAFDPEIGEGGQERFLKAGGEMLAGLIRDGIDGGIPPPLAPSTLQQRSSGLPPLGHLREAVDHVEQIRSTPDEET